MHMSPCIPNRAARENKHEYENDAVQRKINNSENITAALTRRWRAYGSERIWQDVLPQVGDGWMPADCARHSSHSHRTVMTSLLMASDLIMTDRNTCLPRTLTPPSPPRHLCGMWGCSSSSSSSPGVTVVQ
ncbi:unnamed protein product [Arctogadus glacialis]